MAGGKHTKPSPAAASSSSSHRKTNNNKPHPQNTHRLPPFPFPDPPPPPSYGFHMLDRRTVLLADGSVRSYFALPPDYQDFSPFPISPEISIKRKYVDEERQRQQLLQFGNPNRGADDGRANKFMRLGGDGNAGNSGRSKHNEVDQAALKKAFLYFVKVIYENGNHKSRYLDDGKQGPLRCLACQRSSKDVPDLHALVMHAYNPESADSLVDHLGFHKALCILMGWNFLMPPDISKLYQKLPADQASANQENLILWPPLVIIHNTITGRGREGRMEGLGNRTVDNKLRDLGVSSGKSKSLYSRDGHLGITLVKFSGDESGLKEAMRLAGHFEKDGHGRRGWAQVPSSSAGKDDESNPHLVKVDPRTGEKNRILYGYLATVMDLDKVDFETRKKVTVESRRDHR